MPSTLVHYTFALKHLHEDFGYREAILLGAQGPDPWEMYGQLPWCHRKDAKTVRRMGRDTQLSPCEGNYRGFIEYALHSDDKDLLFAYIDGLLMHYCLDRACHPYVFWNTGFTDRPEDSPSVRQYYNFGHLFFERTLDLIISKREGTYGRPNIALRCPKADVKAISSMWYHVNQNHQKNPCISPVSYEKALKDYRSINRVLHSPKGVIKKIAKTVFGRYSYPYAFPMPHSLKAYGFEGIDFLNETHATWHMPSGEARNESFDDLVNLAGLLYEKMHRELAKIRNGVGSYEALEQLFDGITHEGVTPESPKLYWHLIWPASFQVDVIDHPDPENR